MPGQVLVAGTREGSLFIWQTSATATSGRGAWPQVHQNLRNTNDYTGPGASSVIARGSTPHGALPHQRKVAAPTP
jgi:hypothetical protein